MLGEGDLEMEDLFDNPQPELDEQNAEQRDADRGEDGEAGDKKEEGTKPKKRIVRNPQPKLDAERLTGPRGFGVLPDVYKNIKFKGKGHETEDLKRMLHVLEHWAHRLYPPMPFVQTLHQIEKLGAKRLTKSSLHRFRMGLPVYEQPDDDDNRIDQEDEEEPRDPNPDDVFDELLHQQRSPEDRSTPRDLPGNRTPPRSQSPVFGEGNRLGSVTQDTLTDEQRERIERNKLLAVERRAARYRQMQAATAADQSSTSSLPGQSNDGTSQQASEENTVRSTGSPELNQPIANGATSDVTRKARKNLQQYGNDTESDENQSENAEKATTASGGSCTEGSQTVRRLENGDSSRAQENTDDEYDSEVLKRINAQPQDRKVIASKRREPNGLESSDDEYSEEIMSRVAKDVGTSNSASVSLDRLVGGTSTNPVLDSGVKVTSKQKRLNSDLDSMEDDYSEEIGANALKTIQRTNGTASEETEDRYSEEIGTVKRVTAKSDRTDLVEESSGEGNSVAVPSGGAKYQPRQEEIAEEVDSEPEMEIIEDDPVEDEILQTMMSEDMSLDY